MAYVKRLQDYALRGGSGGYSVEGNRLVQGPAGRMVSVDRAGNIVSGRISGGGDIGYKLPSGKMVGNPYRGALASQAEWHRKNRAKLENKWLREKTMELAKGKNIIDAFNSVMEAAPDPLTQPEEYQKFINSPTVKSARSAISGFLAKSLSDKKGLSNKELAKAYGLKVGGKTPSKYQDKPVKPKMPAPTGKPGIIKKQLKATGNPVEVRGRTKDGKLVVQDLVTMQVFPVAKSDLEDRRGVVAPWLDTPGM